MARSVKKGPYVEAKLEDKVLGINEEKQKKVLSKPGHAGQPSHPTLWDIHLLYIMGINLFLCM